MRLPVAAALLIGASFVSAQEINVAIGPARRPAGLTLFDQIEDAGERAAFRQMWDTREPAAQLAQATRFVGQYPRSIVLREAYEFAARACVTTGDLPAGLDWARRSLRLMPENPFLLALMGDTAMKLGELDLAVRSARDALSHLEHAQPPSPIAPAEWPKTRDGVRATALYIVGRVAALRGQYREAEQSLVAALTLNPDDVEALYTIGVVRMATGADEGAARAFAHVARQNGPLSERATASLRVLHTRSQGARASFEDWTASLKWTAPEPPAPVVSATTPGRYAGSASCRGCHAPVYENWQSTGMARMFRPYRPSDVIGDFSGKQTVDGSARAIREDGKHFIEIRRNDNGVWTRYPVDFLIGSKWQQAYATRLPDSRLLVFPVQYSRLRSAWVNYWKSVDGPGSRRAEIGRFHEIPADAVYQDTCAACHTSQLKFEVAPGEATFREGGINCEMCHGPSLDHVELYSSPESAHVKADGATPVRFGRLTSRQYVAVCAQCHAQSAVHDAQPGGAVNYSETGAPVRIYPKELPSSFSRSAFYRDGRYRATTFISEAFARTECFRTGGATCGSCHDPHPLNAASNPKSLKFAADADDMCLQCHASMRERPERHTRHAAGTEASRCVSCHMPKIMEAVLFQARSHEIDDVPDAEMTVRFGQNDSPNACLMCHRDRDAAWLQAGIAPFTRAKIPALSGSAPPPAAPRKTDPADSTRTPFPCAGPSCNR